MADINVIENTIRERYGDAGLYVYNLIDGQRNTENIVLTAGIQESKVVEMLGFMEEQGIIKMRYPLLSERKAQFNITLPLALRHKMYKHNVKWDEVIAKLVSLYVRNLEKAEAGENILKVFKMHKKAAKKKTAKVTRATAKRTVKKANSKS